MAKNERSVAVVDKKQLLFRPLNKTWSDGLSTLLEQEWQSRDIENNATTAIEDTLWARVTPGTIQRATPDEQQAIERLIEEIRESEAPEREIHKNHFRKRVATLRMSNPDVLVLIAQAAIRGRQSLQESLEVVEYALLDHEFSNQPMRPTFDMDQLGLIAECVQSYAGGHITFDGKNFCFDGIAVPKPSFESFLDSALSSLELLHPVHRRRVPANKKVASEVQAKFAAKYYRSSFAGNEKIRRVYSVENFLNEEISVDAAEWSSSADIFSAYVSWCAARSMLPLAEPVFFKALGRWGVEHVARAKSSRAAGRVPGYRGIALRR